MGNILDYVGQLVLQYPTWSHFIIGAAILIQGELAILLSVFLIVNGDLTWGQFFAAGLGTLVAGEIIVYLFGKMMRNTRFGWRFYKKRKANRKIQAYTYYLKTNLIKLLIVAKFLVGANFIVLLLTGWSKTKLGYFLKAYLSSVLLWFFSMTAVAYFLNSGLHYLRAEKIFRNVEIAIVLVFVIIFASESFMKRALKRAGGLDDKSEIFGKFMEEEGEKEESEKKEEEPAL